MKMIARRDKEDNLFSAMQQEALQKLQALSGNRWTDFNAHDPGVTILEAVHYALLELDYRLRFPIESYLSGKGKVNFDKLGLLNSKTFEESSIVSPADYEKLICTHINGVEQCRVLLDHNRRYRIEIVAGTKANKEQIHSDVYALYHANRNLCECLGEIVFTDTITPASMPNIEDETPQFAQQKQSTDTMPDFSAAYYSLQNIFPNSYGINEKGLPAGSSALRKTQARQLKAYLLVFDFLIANTLHQAGNTPVLLGLNGEIPPEYKPNFSIGDMENLLDEAERQIHPLQDSDFLHKQKSLLLDRLDVLYGEDTRRMVEDEKSLPGANHKRAHLLQHLPELNKNRFRACNLLGNSLSGIEEFFYALKGNDQSNVIYPIEHILLNEDEAEANRLSLVCPEWWDYAREELKLQPLLRERLPVHLTVRFVPMTSCRLCEFERNYYRWKKAWCDGNEQQKALFAKQMIQLCRGGTCSAQDIEHGYE
ncbi:MAG: hypothetical protein LBR81_06460 [Prevotellaceae bacterium]|jgi:hypothetical protein|nr:hypothetical protein [Prevotellaceae bacterium]